MAKHKSQREQIGNWCRHFTGIHERRCKVGVDYMTVRSDDSPAKFPCLKDHGVSNCPQQSFLTEAELDEAVAKSEAAMNRTMLCVQAAHAHAKERGLKRGNGGQGTLPCPACKTGTLAYSVSAYNGHMHARCSTANCVSWME